MSDHSSTTGFSAQTGFDHTTTTTTSNQSFLLRFIHAAQSLLITRTSQYFFLQSTASKLQACLTYFASPFALVWIGMAIVLHKILIFASTRQPASISAASVLILRLMALYLLTRSYLPILNLSISSFLSSTHKTGPWSVLAVLAVHFQKVIPTLITTEDPSKMMLWQLYISMCVSQCIEAFLNVVQSLPAFPPWGMSPFHYSVAFYEAQILERYNSQLFAVATVGALNPICNHTISLLGLERFRLIPSFIIGATFLGYYVHCLFSGTLFEFPSICVPKFMPQVLLTLMASVGLMVHLLALVTCKNRPFLNVQTLEAWTRLSLSDDFDRFLTEFSEIAVTSLHGLAYFNSNYDIWAPPHISLHKDATSTAYNKEIRVLEALPKLSASYFEGPPLVNTIKRAASLTVSAHWAIRAYIIRLYRSLNNDATRNRIAQRRPEDKETLQYFFSPGMVPFLTKLTIQRSTRSH